MIRIPQPATPSPRRLPVHSHARLINRITSCAVSSIVSLEGPRHSTSLWHVPVMSGITSRIFFSPAHPSNHGKKTLRRVDVRPGHEDTYPESSQKCGGVEGPLLSKGTRKHVAGAMAETAGAGALVTHLASKEKNEVRTVFSLLHRSHHS